MQSNPLNQHPPIRFDHFLYDILYDETKGYYATKNPIGRGGDYITAPEMTQAFGEMLGVWICTLCQQLPQFKKIHLIEMGPGKGTMMGDIIRVIGKIIPYHSLEITFIEKSPLLQQQQKEHFPQAQFYPHVSETPELSQDSLTFIISNEFFDSLPVRQFQQKGGELYETYVVEGKLDQIPLTKTEGFPLEIIENGVYEYSPETITTAEHICYLMKAKPVVFLTIDYGYFTHKPLSKPTTQALKENKIVNLLDHLGQADLSSYVNFHVLNNVFLSHHLPTQITLQKDFLMEMGITERTEQLCKAASPHQAQLLTSALYKLTAPSEMGDLFKVFCSHSNLPLTIPGFSNGLL